MTMEEGVLVRWLVDDGAEAQDGQPLFELETEKVSFDVPADGGGTLRQLVPGGTTLKPGALIGCFLAAGETEVPAEFLSAAVVTSSAAEQSPFILSPSKDAAIGGAETAPTPALMDPPAETSAPPPTVDAPEGERVVASPYARRLAREAGIDLAGQQGSGPGGRITEQDVRALIDAGPARPSARTTLDAVTTQVTAEGAKYTGRRRTIGERMVASVHTAPQVTLSSETRVDEALEMIHGLNREWRNERVVVTLPILVIKACALALLEHPRLAARIHDDAIVEDSSSAIGLAVDDPNGLMVPVVHGVAALSLHDVARQVAALLDKVRDSALTPDDVQGGSFTVSAMDGTVVDAFTPIINPPQSAILGLGRVREVPAFHEGVVERSRVTTLSLTFDHRVLDGAPAARFLARVAELLSRPYLLM
jgi:pyruvate/2-oxoglutarate dehydrogenase complex dihydrolipoamide acyltransferase (E2) component